MKKFTGNFTPNAGKVLKNSERIICRVDEGGTVYITNGYFAFKLYPHEYTAAIQPAVCCEAGNWTMNNGQKTEEPPTFDLIKTFQDAEHKAAGMEALERCPLNLDTGKKRTAAAFYNAAQGFAALYNAQYLEALAPGYTLRSPGSHAPAAEPKTAAELIASRWSNVDGVTVTIKGAQTTSPVVWLTGDTDPHADEIKAQGGKWSNKRGAYYVRVA